MEQFYDTNGQTVQYLKTPYEFSEKASHVLVICKYRGKWLLTQHKTRGLEFPGGKVEANESLEKAAEREVLEETGATLSQIEPIGVYKVSGPSGPFIKKVFLGWVKEISDRENYYETNGPVLIEEAQLMKDRFNDNYSFIMQDKIIEICLGQIKNEDEGEKHSSSIGL